LSGCLEAVRRKLGTAKNSQQAGWRVSARPLGWIYERTYVREFSDGKGTESFVILLRDDKGWFQDYKIDSPAPNLKTAATSMAQCGQARSLKTSATLWKMDVVRLYVILWLAYVVSLVERLAIRVR